MRKPYDPYVPAGPTRERLVELYAAGATVRGVAAATGLTPSGVSGVMRPNQTRVQQRTANLIAATTLRDVISATTGRVPSVGTKRRIQALMAMGWRHEDIEAHSGVRTHVLIGAPRARLSTWVMAETHRAILATYDALWDRRGPGGERTRRHAQRMGWALPMAWDDDSIDDPEAKPASAACTRPACTRPPLARGLCGGHYEEQRTGRTLKDRTWIDVEALRDFAGWGMTTQQAADRLGVQRDSILTRISREADPDLTARFARNDVDQEVAA